MTFTLADRYREAFENNTQLDYEIWFDETPDAEESAHQDYLQGILVDGLNLQSFTAKTYNGLRLSKPLKTPICKRSRR